MVDAAAKLNLEANYEKTFSITSQRFAAAKYFYSLRFKSLYFETNMQPWKYM